MIKKLLLISLYMLPAMAMENKNRTCEISVRCNDTIQEINQDGGKLYYYLKGVFEAMGARNQPEHKPSDILNFLLQESDINNATQLSHMPATSYLREIISKHFGELDAAFKEKYNEVKNVKEAWAWFEEHFKQKGLAEPLGAYKKQLVEADHERIKRTRLNEYIEKKNRESNLEN